MTFDKATFTKNKLRRLVEEFKIKTGFKKPWKPMDLRHSFAVNFLSKTGDLKRLQYILGHDNVFDTKRLYGEAAIQHASNDVSTVPSDKGCYAIQDEN